MFIRWHISKLCGDLKQPLQDPCKQTIYAKLLNWSCFYIYLGESLIWAMAKQMVWIREVYWPCLSQYNLETGVSILEFPFRWNILLCLFLVPIS